MTPEFASQEEKIKILSDFVFNSLFLNKCNRVLLISLPETLHERRCHSLSIAVIFAYFAEVAGLQTYVLKHPQFRLIKILSSGQSWILDLDSAGDILTPPRLLELMGNHVFSQYLEVFEEKELRRSTYHELISEHYKAGHWEKVLLLLRKREEEFSVNPEDFALYGIVLEKLERKDEALIYFKRYFSFAPRNHSSFHLVEKYQSLRFDQIENLLSKPELHPSEY